MATLITSGSNIVSTITSGSAGTEYQLQSGGEWVITSPIPLKSGDSLIGLGNAENTRISAAKDVTAQSWTSDSGRWYTSHTMSVTKATAGDFNNADGTYPRSHWGVGLLTTTTSLQSDNLDFTPLEHVDDVADVASGKWFYDEGANRIYIGDDPTGFDKIYITNTRIAIQLNNNNTLENFTVWGSAVEPLTAGIQGFGFTGTTMRNIISRWHSGAGAKLGAECTVTNCKFDDNGQIGLGAGLTASNTYGQPRAEKMVFLGCTFNRNNWQHTKYNGESGGYKMVRTRRCVVMHCSANDNIDANGHWWDIVNSDAVIMYNHAYNNGRKGIYYELAEPTSNDRVTIIAHNDCKFNGQSASILQGASPSEYNFLYDAQIQIENAPDVHIFKNSVVTNGDRSITVRQTDRGATFHGSNNVEIFDNDIYYQTNMGYMGIFESYIGGYGAIDVTFTNNRIHCPTGATGGGYYTTNTTSVTALTETITQFNARSFASGNTEDTTQPASAFLTPVKPVGFYDYRSVILALPEVVAYYPLDEESGATTVYDYGGQSFNGTPANVTFGASGVANSTSASFNGSTSNIDIYASGFNDLLPDKNDWGAFVLFKVSGAGVWTNGADNFVYHLGKWFGANTMQLSVRKDDPTNEVRFYSNQNTSLNGNNASMSDTGWIAACSVINRTAGTISHYLAPLDNTGEMGTAAVALTGLSLNDASSSNFDTAVIGDDFDGGNSFDGTIAHFVIFSDVVTSDVQDALFAWRVAPAIEVQDDVSYDEGDAVSITLYHDCQEAFSVAVTGLPASLSYTDNADGTGTISGTLVDGDNGTHAITITATTDDTPTLTTTRVFNINVADTLSSNNAPVWTSVSNRTDDEGDVISFNVTVTDAEDTCTLTASGLPAGISFTDNGDNTGTISGTIAYTANASSPYTVTLTADDGTNAAVDETFDWTVNNVNRAPVINGGVTINNVSLTEGQTQVVNITATDADGDAVSITVTQGDDSPLPAWITYVDNGNGTAAITIAPQSGDAGNITVKVTASDS